MQGMQGSQIHWQASIERTVTALGYDLVEVERAPAHEAAQW